MRLRVFSDKIPKPMVPIGYRPILWYIMKYYAHFGHKDFILCLGYQGDTIKNYFVNYCEYTSNDFVFSKGGNSLTIINKDIEDWTITFADTGINSTVNARLLAVEKYLKGEEYFLANYSDALTDLPLPEMIREFHRSEKTGMMLITKPQRSFHVVDFDKDKTVMSLTTLADTGLWINAGYFIFHRDFFKYLKENEELADNALPRLAKKGLLAAYPYEGNWVTMDTFKEKQMLDDMYSRGDAPWEVWKEKPNLTKVSA